MREKKEVINFLKKHPFLVPFLLEAPEKIRHHFQQEKLTLKVIYDPEIIDCVQLLLSISTSVAPDEALKKLELLDKDWWLELPDRVWNLLLPTLEYNNLC